jgi:hypothetical protein
MIEQYLLINLKEMNSALFSGCGERRRKPGTD